MTRSLGRRRGRRDTGVSLLLVAFAMVGLLTAAALAIDIAAQVNEKQALHDTLDAAAHAGAYKLPTNGAGAEADALAFALANDPDSNPVVDFFCITGVNASGGVDTSFIPTACDPGPGPYVVGSGGVACNDSICAIPCDPDLGDKCNSIRVRDAKDVDYRFAPVIGNDKGSTGTLTSAACKGGCGTLTVQPIDFAVVGDRTGSMGSPSGPNMPALEAAMVNLLEYLTPTLHHVAIGTIGRSSASPPISNCPSYPSGSRTSGPFVPAQLSNDYDLTDVSPPSSPASLNPASRVAQAAQCIGDRNSGTGTDLPGAMDAAHNELVSPRARAEAQQAIIFMTDGVPNVSGFTTDAACTATETQANQAKSAGILVVTIAFRLEGERCSSSKSALDFLAGMASDVSGVPSQNDSDGPDIGSQGCSSSTEAAVENSDGDYFFCTPDPDDLEEIFETAVDSVEAGIRLIKLPE